jgi:enamine deaminase RidA (YjgF/YER057c/UK114 family)
MEISTRKGRRLLISGTASIALEGETLYAGDVRGQIARTMDVVEAMLESRGLKLSDVTRATAYFKNAADVFAFEEWQRAHKWNSTVVVPVNCDICRDDLLFELEADAWLPLNP